MTVSVFVGVLLLHVTSDFTLNVTLLCENK